jgi:rhodanese-related sulfurtransferase
VFGRSLVPSVDVRDVADDAVVLDVREVEEWVAGHQPGATHIPLGQLPARLAEIGELSTERVVVVCRSGHRSARVVQWLEQQGHEAVNLDGGLIAWAAAGRAMVSESGAPPAVV